ncbi:aminoglycoside phosphotransferase [Streptomyces sp. NPDC059009]|uniref:maltokinase N-terminal cap-like domain-containing protein n=1 Tax=Streptomyces sp. NPDC059009 TaxID=3346694 RepID=UPI00367B4173
MTPTATITATAAATDVFTAPALEQALVPWLPGQRWFDGTGRTLSRVHVTGCHLFAAPDGPDHVSGAHLVVRAEDTVGADAGSYHLVLGARPTTGTPPGPALAVVGDTAVYDALTDPGLVRALLLHMASGTTADGVRFGSEPPGFELSGTSLTVRPLQAEQSNSSVIINDQYILKIFRRYVPGASPDLVLHRMLRDQGSLHVPPLLGAAERHACTATLATLQRYLPKAEDGWAAALASVRSELVGQPADDAGDFTHDSHALGHALALVHRDLARAAGEEPLRAAEYHHLSELFLRRLTHALDQAPRLAPYAGQLHEVFSAVRHIEPAAHRSAHLVHGDLHLGQTLRTSEGWLLLDFEGEPLAARAERTARHSPLRDVAAMLRSYDYAAHHELTDTSRAGGEHIRALGWVRRNQGAFLSGYHETVGAPGHADDAALLTAYELDKAVYEVLYDTRHRPDWAWIPLRALERALAPRGLPAG